MCEAAERPETLFMIPTFPMLSTGAVRFVEKARITLIARNSSVLVDRTRRSYLARTDHAIEGKFCSGQIVCVARGVAFFKENARDGGDSLPAAGLNRRRVLVSLGGDSR